MAKAWRRLKDNRQAREASKVDLHCSKHAGGVSHGCCGAIRKEAADMRRKTEKCKLIDRLARGRHQARCHSRFRALAWISKTCWLLAVLFFSLKNFLVHEFIDC